MASGYDPCPEHHTPTRRGKRYCFYDKHHRRGITEPAQWDPNLSRDEEFAIFDNADWLEIRDDRGNLYGLRRSPEGLLLSLGAGGEQIAKFWKTHDDTPWHGFPLIPIAEGTESNRKKDPISKEVLRQMELAGLLNPAQARRLSRGREAK